MSEERLKSLVRYANIFSEKTLVKTISPSDKKMSEIRRLDIKCENDCTEGFTLIYY